jgi:hypothetical protein
MAGLTPAKIGALIDALGIPVASGDLAEVTHRLNALVDALAPLRDLPLRAVEPLPLPPEPAP